MKCSLILLYILGTVTKREPLKSYCDIFKPRCAKSPQPRRILVEGRAGVGKSTFASKLSYDWASGSDYLLSFKVLIVCINYSEKATD